MAANLQIPRAIGIRVAGFEWDRANREKLRTASRSLLSKEHSNVRSPSFPIPGISTAEERFKAIGITTEGRQVLIVFTLRSRGGDTFIRPISARCMHRKEVEYYENTATSPEE